jgi:hypothetical protein
MLHKFMNVIILHVFFLGSEWVVQKSVAKADDMNGIQNITERPKFRDSMAEESVR